jgi:hypothetical protein
MTGISAIEQIPNAPVAPKRNGAVKDLNVRPPVGAEKDASGLARNLGLTRKT